jgi:hypothetical protein
MAPIASRCRNDSPLRCEWRASLSEREPDRLRYSYEAGNWLLWLGAIPEAVEVCPGCGGALPQIGPVVAKLQAQGWVDSYTGEDGG